MPMYAAVSMQPGSNVKWDEGMWHPLDVTQSKQNLYADIPPDFSFVCVRERVCAPVQIKYILKHITLLKENLKCTNKDLYDAHPLELLVSMVVRKYS